MDYTLTIPPSRARSLWESSVRSDYRLMGNAELAADEEVTAYAVAAADHLPAADRAVVLDLDGFRLQAIREERAHRAALHAVNPHLPDPRATEYEAWQPLARNIRERADVIDLLQLAGCHLERAGREWAGPCPRCGGHDRFRAWSAADGKRPGFWCRGCHFSGDAITAYRELLVPGASFFDATRTLALQLGLRTPDHGSARQPRIEILRERVIVGELTA